jgi:hypothetical protein
MTDDETIKQLRGKISDIISQISYPEDTIQSFKNRYTGKEVLFKSPNHTFRPMPITVDFIDSKVVAIVGGNTFNMAEFEKMLYSGSNTASLVEASSD